MIVLKSKQGLMSIVWIAVMLQWVAATLPKSIKENRCNGPPFSLFLASLFLETRLSKSDMNAIITEIKYRKYLSTLVALLLMGACTNEPNLEALESKLGQWTDFEKQIESYSLEQQDLLRLQLAVRYPKHSQYLCKKVQSTLAIEKCKQVIGRPHLQGAQ